MSTTKPRRGVWSAYGLGGLTVLAAGLLWQGLSAPPAAYGQVPDSGAQRNEMIKELREANKKLGEMTALLREIRDTQKADKAESGRQPAPKRPTR